MIGVDYAGPIWYWVSKQWEGKAYVLLYACSLTQGIYLDLLPNLETEECLKSFKQFIARRGRPEQIYSDNSRTFIGAANWIRAVMKDEWLQTYLSINQIKWQFNLSRTPWWGGQFERLIGLVKSALNKTIGNGLLWWKELQEVLLDVEITLNNRPLSYVEDDLQMPLLTLNAMLFLNSNLLPELQLHHIETADLRKWAKHLLKCKEAVWSRWTNEYLRSLRERHREQWGAGRDTPAFGDVVIIKTDTKTEGSGRWESSRIWSLEMMESLEEQNCAQESPTWNVRSNNFTHWNNCVTGRWQHPRQGWTQRLPHFAQDGMLQLQHACVCKRLPKRKSEMNSPNKQCYQLAFSWRTDTIETVVLFTFKKWLSIWWVWTFYSRQSNLSEKHISPPEIYGGSVSRMWLRNIK